MNLAPLKIGDLTVDWPVMLAPMAGLTDAAMRSICREHHCGLTFTEVVSSEGVIRGWARTMHFLKILEGERPVAAHIYGSEPDRLAKAAEVIESLGSFDFIDINSGCPVRKIVGAGAGAALIRTPDKIHEIVKAVKSAVSLPVTVKTRIGFSRDDMNIVETVQAIEAAGGAAVFIHARFAENNRASEVDWDALALAKESCSIPVIGNGGINVAEDVSTMLERTGVDGVMIGRAACGNPGIFDQVHCMLKNLRFKPHEPAEHKALVLDHLRRLIEHGFILTRRGRKRQITPEQYAVSRFRPHLYMYFRNCRGVTELGRRLNDMKTVADVASAIDAMPATAGRRWRLFNSPQSKRGRPKRDVL